MDWPDTSLTLIQFIPLDVEPLGPMSPLHSTASTHRISASHLWINANANHMNYQE